MIKRNRRPTHPGKMLRELFLRPHSISVTSFAEMVECSRTHMSQIVNGKRRIEAGMATKISVAIGNTPQFWLNAQNAVDLFDAAQQHKDWKPKGPYPIAG